MSRSRFSKLVSVVITGVIAISGLPLMVLADVINSPTYYSVQTELDYEITTNITSSWINHESIDLVLTNTGIDTIHNWYLTFNTPYNIENIWNGTIYETDGNGTYTITSNGWNQDIRTGESVTVGITFSSDTETELSVDPTWYLLNTQATGVDASQYTLEYTEYSAWETGFTGQLTLTPQVDCQHWELSFSSNREITAASSAVLIPEGDNNYAITHDENNMRLFASNAYNFGIQGVNTEEPLEFSNVELEVVDLAYHLTDDADANGIPDYLDYIGGGSIVEPTPTPVPTETPTVTLTEEPTLEPSDTPTPTPAIDYELDRDSDGLPDYIEDQIDTDPLKADTDDDELSDYIEIMLSYDPINPDTDGNGITDGNEDFDNDGLSNLQELQLGTEPCFEDSDGDYLNDGDELSIYGTDPLVPDTDGDGINDGDEISIGKNPSDGSDGVTRVPQTFTQSINNPEDASITSVDVSISVANRIDRVVDVDDYYNVDVYSTGVYGRIGSPLNFECDEDFDTANVVIHYDETALGDALEENLGVLWFDEETGFYITQEQAVVDTTNNTVTLVLEHFSTYVLVNLNKWNNPPISPIEPLLLSGSVRTVRYETVGVYYDAFPIYEQNEAGEWIDTGRFYGGTIAPERNERNARNQYLSSNPNNVILETISVGHYTVFGGLRYTYTWLVSTNEYEDNDHDGVPDTLEVNGIYAVGQGDDLYTSHVDEESGADSDGDLVPDLEEYRAIYIISKSSEDGAVSVTRISANGQEILDSDSGFYNLAISYVDSVLDPGETFAFCTPRSNPDDPDSDDDYYSDHYDHRPRVPSVYIYGLEGAYEIVLEEEDNQRVNNHYYYLNQTYTLIDNCPNCPGETYYGGYQGWFGNNTYDSRTNSYLQYIQSAGCGIVATNDTRLYLENGSKVYSYDDYRSALFDTYYSFDPYAYVLSANGSMLLYSAPPDPVRVVMAFEQLGYNAHIERTQNTSESDMLSDIEESIERNSPVILCEIDPTWRLFNYVASQNEEGVEIVNSYEGLPLLNPLYIDPEGNGFSTPTTDNAPAMSCHYVTITGVVEDRISHEAWLRVQTWGRIDYIRFSDFYNHNSPTAPNLAMGSIIIVE